VTGLGAGNTLTLRNFWVQGSTVTPQDRIVSADGTFAFDPIPPSSIYQVISFQVIPANPSQPQTCTVNNNIGFAITNVTSVHVECENTGTTYRVGGQITGLTANGLVLSMNPSNPALVPAANATTFQFPKGLTAGTEFKVGVAAQPAGQTCVPTHYGSHMGTSDYVAMQVDCINNATDQLIGTYIVSGTGVAANTHYFTFYPTGLYVYATLDQNPSCGTNSGNGVEYGAYHYDQSTGDLAVLTSAVDTNGSCGLWNGGVANPGSSGKLQKTGLGQNAVLTFTAAGNTYTLTPVSTGPETIVGAWVGPPATGAAVLGSDGHYLIAETNDDPDVTNDAKAGVEYGCYSFTGTTSGTLTTPATACPGSIDTNGSAGFDPGTNVTYTLTGPYTASFGNDDLLITRIVPN
jgi:hypothetical protein